MPQWPAAGHQYPCRRQTLPWWLQLRGWWSWLLRVPYQALASQVVSARSPLQLPPQQAAPGMQAQQLLLWALLLPPLALQLLPQLDLPGLHL